MFCKDVPELIAIDSLGTFKLRNFSKIFLTKWTKTFLYLYGWKSEKDNSVSGNNFASLHGLTPTFVFQNFLCYIGLISQSK